MDTQKSLQIRRFCIEETNAKRSRVFATFFEVNLVHPKVEEVHFITYPLGCPHLPVTVEMRVYRDPLLKT